MLRTHPLYATACAAVAVILQFVLVWKLRRGVKQGAAEKARE